MLDATTARPTTETAPLWPGLVGSDDHGPFIEGGRCGACGGLALGVRDICPFCHAEGRMGQERIGRRGTLYSATIVHQAPRGFSAPFRIGYVDVEEGVRVFSHIETGPGAAQIGDSVTLTLGPVKTGEDGAALVGPLYVRDGRQSS